MYKAGVFTRGGLLGLCGVVLLLIVNVVVSYQNVRQLNEDARWVIHTHEVLDALTGIRARVSQAEDLQQSYLLTGTPALLPQFRASLDAAEAAVDQVEYLTADNPIQQGRIPTLRAQLQTTERLLTETADVRQRQGFEAARRLVLSGQSRREGEGLRRLVGEMEADEHRLLQRRQVANQRAFQIALISGLVAAAIGLAALAMFAWLLHQYLDTRARATAAIEERGERLRTTLASIGDGVITTDVEGRVTNLNPVAEALTGWTTADALGQPLTTVFDIVNETTRLPVENPALRALKEGIIVGLANHTILLARDGVERPIDDSAAPIRGNDGQIVGGVLVFRDVTERRAEEKAQVERSRLVALRAEVSTALASIQPTDTVLQSCCEALVRQLDVAFARIWTHDEANGMLELQASAGLQPRPDDPQARIKLGEYKIGRIAARQRPYLTNDVQHDPKVSDPEWAMREGMVAFAGYPLLVEEKVVGVLALFARQPLTETILTDLAPLTDQIAQYLQRKRADAALRASEERRERALEAAAIGSWHLGSALQELTTDERFRAIFGVTEGPLTYAQAVDLIHPADRDRVREAVAAATRPLDPQPYVMEHRLSDPDGTVRWVLVQGRADFDPEAPGKLVSFDGTIMDITARKQAEEQLRESEEFNRSLMSSSSDCIKVLGLDGRLLYMNPPGLCSMEIDDFEPFCGRRWEELWPTEAGEELRRAMGRALAGESASFQAFCPTAKGTPRWWDVAVSPVRDTAAGQVVRLLVVSRDITESKQLELALRESEAHFRSMADNAPVMLWVSDPTGGCTYLSRQWYEFTGRPVGKDEGLGWLEAVHPEDLANTREIFLDANERHIPFSIDYRVRRHDGEYRWAVDAALPRFEGEVFQGFVGCVFDVHHRKELEDELRQLAAALSEADHRKDEFLATLAHELRNPLAPIRNGLQVLKLAGPNSDAAARARSMMERQLGQLVRLVDDLMDVSRITRGKTELRREPVPLATVLNSAVETSRPLIEQMGHTLTMTLPEQPIIVNADLTRLAQVFLNLLNNAAKYSDRGGQIRLTAERQGEWAVVSVRDTGIGIAAESLPRIFDLFTQVDRSLEKAQGGLGIGLTLVKRLVEMHGGSVEARSDGPGRGAEFVVRLPITVEATLPQSDEAADLAPETTFRILIVDDNVDGADSLAMMLRTMGHETRTAYDGLAGVALAEQYRPDVALFDIGLPKLNGYEACRRIRETPWGKELVLIAVTGWGQEDDRRRSREAGFDHHLVKPVNPSGLAKLIEAL